MTPIRHLGNVAPIVLVMLFQAAFGSKSAVPRFEDYPAGQIYKGAPAALKPGKPWTQMYAAEIQDGVNGAYRDANPQKGPNFAGHLVVAMWGCGAPCLRMAIVDAQTGEIYFPPLTFSGNGPGSFDLPLLTVRGSVPRNPEVRFRPDSSLMIVKATPGPTENDLSYAFYFLWKQDRWTLVRKHLLSTP